MIYKNQDTDRGNKNQSGGKCTKGGEEIMEVMYIFGPLILMMAYISYKELEIKKRKMDLEEKKFNLYSSKNIQKSKHQ